MRCGLAAPLGPVDILNIICIYYYCYKTTEVEMSSVKYTGNALLYLTCF